MKTDTVEYKFKNDTPGTWRFDAIKGDRKRLPFGSDSIYVIKSEEVTERPTKVTAVFTIE